MTSLPYSRSRRTAVIRSGRAGGLAGELLFRQTKLGDYRWVVIHRHRSAIHHEGVEAWLRS